MDICSQSVAYRCHISVGLFEYSDFLLLKMCLAIAAWISFFCLPEGRWLEGRGGADPDWMWSWYRIYLSAGWITNQETNSWNISFIPNNIWRSWSWRLGGCKRWSSHLLCSAFSSAVWGPSWGLRSRLASVQRLEQCPSHWLLLRSVSCPVVSFFSLFITRLIFYLICVLTIGFIA